jgi:Lamin Tail Domain/CHU_C Type IX secretion signal domain
MPPMKKINLLLIVTFFLPMIVLSQNRYDIVIDELMADPSPQIGLPANEWIELKNTSAAAINLAGWRIGDASGLSGPMPNFTLQPDSFVIVCTAGAVTAMSAFGTAISVTSFPSLDNDGDMIFLRANNGKTIHAVSYSSAWYQNAVKADGGWTLEMIDTKNPCAGSSNWKAGSDLKGGTPGKKNSIDAVNKDTDPPKLKRAFTTDNTTIILVFDEPIDSLKGATISNHTIDGGIGIQSAIAIAPLFNQIQLKTGNPLQANTVYTITSANITDCKNNIIGTANKVKTGLPADPLSNELIINEILFNPRSNGYDFIEFYNRSNKIFDAAKLFIANRNTSGAVSSVKVLSTAPFYIFPGEYVVITEDADNLAVNYLVKNPEAVLTISSMPSFPDDEGDVVLLNFQGQVTDEVKYKDDWHFKLLDNTEGVSLERIDAEAASQDAGNWHSAASTAGYGTPGYQNSQFKQTQQITATITVTPKIFSPDNDGRDDIATIQYQTTEPGYIANITVFDAAGRPVRYFVKNGTLGLKGNWNWDGLDEKGNKLPVGTYIIFTEIFNLQGKKERFKNTIVLARKLN